MEQRARTKQVSLMFRFGPAQDRIDGVLIFFQ
jgi:hypothetical protein